MASSNSQIKSPDQIARSGGQLGPLAEGRTQTPKSGHAAAYLAPRRKDGLLASLLSLNGRSSVSSGSVVLWHIGQAEPLVSSRSD